MRRIIIFILCILLSLSITTISVYVMYTADILQERTDYGFGDVKVESGEAFLEVYFYDEAVRQFSGYKIDESNNIIYIKVFASYQDKNKLKPDESGYIYLRFPVSEEITEIRYVTKDGSYSLWKKEIDE